MVVKNFTDTAIPNVTKLRLLLVHKHLAAKTMPEDSLLTSAALEKLTGIPRDTIRKDISFLKGVDGSATGYHLGDLSRAIEGELSMTAEKRLCIVGLGRLGSAYLSYFESGEGAPYTLAAGFDSNVNRLEVLSVKTPLFPAYKLKEVAEELEIEAALLCVPEEAAQQSADKLIEAGVRGIINFTPAAIVAPKELQVRNVDLKDELKALFMSI
ncbi:MAG: Gfo/Idh/MocA family oxidoreductase [Spirochaetaceae bacterium]|jgi:redox-sensing transcriptional repressor|nr:Gfo/Idh/MocA family oxidoreductase [Spirochaetaceae bacterium]